MNIQSHRSASSEKVLGFRKKRLFLVETEYLKSLESDKQHSKATYDVKAER